MSPLLPDAKEARQKIAIIKADDIRGITAKWDRFLALSAAKGVKVSAGIICNSLRQDKSGYFAWLKKHLSSGMVEFWNHGWDHSRWQDSAGASLREFSGSGYLHQKRHFENAQTAIKRVLGIAPICFGAPFNAMDKNTIKVLNESTHTRLIFAYEAAGLTRSIIAPMALRGEADGTGKPNFAAFKAQYDKQRSLSFSSIQFHPNGFSEQGFQEYAKILDLLLAEGWSFILPSEYVAMQQKIAKEKP
jgi:peptidoglycan/xylan/chitin deacetylase (PgdA/CDA1 family)